MVATLFGVHDESEKKKRICWRTWLFSLVTTGVEYSYVGCVMHAALDQANEASLPPALEIVEDRNLNLPDTELLPAPRKNSEAPSPEMV